MKKKILVVEDDPDVRQGYHIRLAANHYETFFAADGSPASRRRRRTSLI
jgi:DNA-binding response OmpR family regulator